MRKIFIAGNWKMNCDAVATVSLIEALRSRESGWPDVDVAVHPPFVGLDRAAVALKGSGIRLGAQNMHEAASGAFTGEVAAGMLLTVGCRSVILGHSERRQLFAESDGAINRKVHAALEAGLEPIVCCGETLKEREQGVTLTIVERQLKGALEGVSAESMSTVTIAYEPVWAIGTGKTATTEQAGDVHRQIRAYLGQRFSADVAAATRIQYGGSVKAANAAELLADPDIDGALVGGASLKVDEFDAIIKAAG